MKPLPYVTEGLEIPAEQAVAAGRSGDYVGIYVLDEEPRIVVTLTNPPFKFGRVENWSPVFCCPLPITIGASDKEERFFQIRFSGVPGPRDEFVSGRLCVRKVEVTSISKMFEGDNPPMVR
jgi:hypothetical protein